MRRISLIFLLILSFVLLSGNYASAEEYGIEGEGPIDYGIFLVWHANVGMIGHLAQTYNTVGVEVESNTMNYSDAVIYTDHVISAWTMRNFTLTRVARSNYNSANLKVKTISRATADALGLYPSWVAANERTASFVGFGRYWDLYYRDIDVYEISNYQTYLIWDTTTSNFSPDQWKSVYAHEHGHGIGYYGHDGNKSSLMYLSLQNPPKLVPADRDKAHMRNVYIID